MKPCRGQRGQAMMAVGAGVVVMLVMATACTDSGVRTSLRTRTTRPTDESSTPDDTVVVDTVDTVDDTVVDDTVVNSTGSIDWEACDDPAADGQDVDCATLTVPLDYDDPSPGSIDLALVRVPASDDRIGAVLFNPGGPGGSGFDPIAQFGTGLQSALGLESFDLIGFDPRGVDRSNGIRCMTDLEVAKALSVDSSPDTPYEVEFAEQAEAAFYDGCQANYGDELQHYSTANTARDMDAMRDAMGDEQISYLGISYGTFLGATYATLFPDRVRAMVLDSAYEPNGDTIEQQYETQLVGFEGAFNNWAAWCEDSPDCAFTAPDVGARWDVLRDRLDFSTLTASDGRHANNAIMERATTAALYSDDQWPVLAQALADAEAGDPDGIYAMADEYNGRNADGTYNTLFQSYQIIQCASGIEPEPATDPDALAARLKELAPRFAADVSVDDLAEGSRCDDLVSASENIPLSYSGDGPIVVVGGTNDPATPIRWAEEMDALLGNNSALVRFTGEGHGQLLASTCVTDIESTVLRELRLPTDPTTCDPDPVIARPDFFDTLGTPSGVSDPIALPAVMTALGITDTQFYAEARTTDMDFDEVADAYQTLFEADGLEFFGTQDLPINPATSVNFVLDGNVLIVITIGYDAFDSDELISAKASVPDGQTVVVVAYFPT